MKLKGINILILSFFVSIAAFAQKPQSGKWLSEAYLNANSLSPNFSQAGLRARHFFNPETALRVDLSVGNFKTNSDIAENADGTGSVGASVDKTSTNGIGLGIEKHFNGNAHFSPFIGGSVAFALLSMSGEHTNTDGTTYLVDYSESSSQKGSGFGVWLFSGADYWINQSFYLGGEFGLNFSSSTLKNGESSMTSGGSTVQSVILGSTSTSFGENVVASIRVGYKINGNGGLFGSKKGKKDKDNDGVADVDDKCPNTPAGINVNASGCPSFGDEIQLLAKNIYFEIDSDIIKEESFSSLDKIAGILKLNRIAKVSVEGHTDNTASHDYNMDLSERRAQSVLQYLKNHEIAAERMTARGYGETQSVSSNDNAEGRALNRRVELNIFY